MRYWVASFTASLFFLWLLPLGVFIKPSQEKLACGGQRAICMCSHAKAEAKGSPLAASSLKAPSDASKESSSSGGASHYVAASSTSSVNRMNLACVHRQLLFLASDPFLRSIEPVPKV